MTCNFGTMSFVFADFRNEGSIGLEFAIEVEIYVAFFQDFYSLADRINRFAGAGTLCRIGQESHFRIEHLYRAAGTFYADACDISELFGRRIRNNAAVAEYEDTIITILRSVGQEDEGTGYSLVAFTGSDDLQAGTDNVSRRRSSTRNNTVSFTESDEAGSEESIVVHHDFMSFFYSHAFLFAAFCKILAQFIHAVVRSRVDDFNTSEVDLEFGSIFFDLIQIADEDDAGIAFSQYTFSSFEYTTAIGFRKDDFLLCLGNTGF